MSKIKKIAKGASLAVMSAILPAVSVFAQGVGDGAAAGAGAGAAGAAGVGGGGAAGEGASSAVGRASQGLSNVNPGANTDLMGQIQLILNAVYVVVGIVAVVMIILGGISYATSQGDAAKVKKGKDTILYGIIGLVVVLLAFAITSFVLMQLGA